MKLFSTLFTFLSIFLGVQHVQAQVQVALHGSYAIPTPKEDETKNLWGGGIQARYFISPNFAAGIGFSRIGQKYDLGTYYGESVVYKENISTIAATAEYFFLDGPLQPYAGLKAGIYPIKVQVNKESETSSVWGLAPKVGLQYELPQNLSVFFEGEYNLLFSKKEARDIGADTIGLKYIQLNLGIAYTFNFK